MAVSDSDQSTTNTTSLLVGLLSVAQTQDRCVELL